MGASDVTDEDIGGYVIRVRRALHSFPETGLDNPVTQQYIIDELTAIPGMEIRSGTSGTSVIARLRTGGPGSTVILRADTDALAVTEDSGESFTSRRPGVAHSCGHDAHVAMLLGAARLLVGRRSQLSGQVLFVFQPGEEGWGGAQALLQDPAFTEWLDPLERDSQGLAFAIHVTPNLPSGAVVSRAGTLMAATDSLTITVRGKGGHAALPQLSVNPVPVVAALVGRLSAECGKAPDSLVTVTSLRAGSAHNVIPDNAQLMVSVRSLNERIREKTLDQIQAAVRTVTGSVPGITADTEVNVSYPCTVNHPAAVRLARDTVAGLPELGWQDLPSAVLTSEDFSYFLQRWTGCMVLLGACPADIPEPAAAPSCHAPQMRIDESVLAAGAALHAAFAGTVCAPG